MLISYSKETPITNQLLPMTTECPICADTYNKSTRAKVTCPWEDCQHECCKSCVRTYLTSTTKDPCCMSCSKPLDMTWIVDNLNRSFYNGDYKQHRSALLLDRTMAQMAEAMPEVERRVEIQKQKDAVRAAQEAARVAAAAARQAAHDLWKLENKETPAEARKFIMGCPRDGCRGFLSTQYKCGLCGYHTCKDCLKCKGHNAEEVEAHVCNPDDIATANLIRSTSKPCPNCGERISKIEGCDQMWCTSCKTAFSWRTGRVDTGVVHNPHFFQFQRTVQNGEAPQQAGLAMCNAQNMPGYYLVRGLTTRLRNYMHNSNIAYNWRPLQEKINDVFRQTGHIDRIEIPSLQRRIDSCTDTMNLRVEYLQEQISKEAMGKKLISNDRRRKRDQQIMDVWQLIRTTGLEICWGMINYNENNEEQFIQVCNDEVEKWEGLCIYCDRAWAIISIEHKCSVPMLTKSNATQWRIGKWHVHRDVAKVYKENETSFDTYIRRICMNGH